MKLLSGVKMLIKFNGITEPDANIPACLTKSKHVAGRRMYANNTNKEIDTESNWITVFIRIIRINSYIGIGV